MTTTAPIIPRSPLDRLRWAVADAWAVTLRDLTHWVHQPATVVVGLLFPVLMVLMFGYLFAVPCRCRAAATTASSSCPACSP